jgi:hypothetical protein
MSRIGICTEPSRGGYRACVPELDLPETFGWTRLDAEAAFLPALRDFVYGLRAAEQPVPELPDYEPPAPGWEIRHYAI